MRARKVAFIVTVVTGIMLLSGIFSLSAQRPVRPGGRDGSDVFGISRQNEQNQMQYGNIPGVVDNNADTVSQDTVAKAPRIRKPLESYFFSDSLRVKRSFAWNTSLRENRVKEITVDTVHNGFQVDYPILQQGVGAAYLGNL